MRNLLRSESEGPRPWSLLIPEMAADISAQIVLNKSYPSALYKNIALQFV